MLFDPAPIMAALDAALAAYNEARQGFCDDRLTQFSVAMAIAGMAVEDTRHFINEVLPYLPGMEG